MSFSPAICPSCKDAILLKDGLPFLVCPLCDAKITAREAGALLEKNFLAPDQIYANMMKCLNTWHEHGPELPIQILCKMAQAFPHHEEIAYLIVKMSDYSPHAVTVYLQKFAHSPQPVPFAGEFLEKALTFRNIGHADQFQTYINEKFKGTYRDKWLEKLSDMRAVRRRESNAPAALNLLIAYYIICGTFNVILATAFIFVKLDFIIRIIVLMAIFTVEVAILFLHNKRFGNRVGMSDRERFLMVCFLSSLIIATGGMGIGLLI